LCVLVATCEIWKRAYNATYAPQNLQAFVQVVREAFRLGSRGSAADDVLLNCDWGFDLADVRPRIDIWHGDSDVNVPPHAVER
jgi:hypothetical protein